MATNVRDHRAGRSIALALALIALAGCAAGGAAGGAGGMGVRKMPGSIQAGTFRPGRAAAPGYGPGPACPGGGAERSAQEQFASTAKRTGGAAPEVDGRLCEVAEAFLALGPNAPQPRDAVLEFVSQWFGLATPVQQILVAEVQTEDPKQVGDSVVEAGQSFMSSATAPRWGLATQRTKRGFTKLVLAVQDARIELNPVPRRLQAGQQAPLAGKLLDGWENPKVAVSDAVGRETAPAQQPGKDFAAEVRCGDRPGRIQVEIRAQRNGSGPIPVANFPIACATDLPASIALAPEPWPAQPAEQERKFFAEANRERTAAGLEPLAWDDAVAGVARTISEALRSGSAGDVRQRLKEAGVVSPLVLQSAAADRSVDGAAERLLRSPSNRANVMNPEATNAGVGVFPTTGSDGKPLVYVTEILIRELPPIDVARARDDLRAAVAQKRKDARARPVHPDATLDAVAERYARALAESGGSLPAPRAAEITKPLEKSFKAVTMVSGAKQEALDFAEEPQAVAGGSALGVGVAQGKNPVLGRNATYVVLMIGTPRAEAAKPTKTAKARGK